MNKTAILNDFLDKYKNLPKQGSDEWLKNRETTFGGSELAALIGKNKNKTCRKLLEEKASSSKFEGNSFTYWGQLFEPVHRAILEMVYNTSIYETGSIPWNKEGFKYSPDGIGVINKAHFIKLLRDKSIMHLSANIEELIESLIHDDKADTIQHMNDQIARCNDILVLFEQKAPANRVLNYAIPEYYIPQILSGLNVINITDIGIYTEAVFKRCPLDKLSLTNIDYNESFRFTKNTFLARPKYIGIIVLSTPDADYAHKLKSAYFRDKYTSDMYIDYGESSSEAFFNILEGWRNTDLIELHYVNDATNDSFITVFESIKSNIIGIIPWKLFDIQNHLVYRRDNYLNSYHPAIMEGINVIKQCKNAADKSDIKKIIDNGVIKIAGLLPNN